MPTTRRRASRLTPLLRQAHRLHTAALDPARWPEVVSATRQRVAAGLDATLSADDQAWLAAIIDSAAAVCAARARLELASALMASAVDALPFGVLTLDGAGTVGHANRIAHEILAASADLRAALPHLVGTSDGMAIRTLPAPSTGAADIELLCLATAASQVAHESEQRFVVFLASAADARANDIADDTALAAAFDLTAAETRVAVRLAAGDSIEDVALALDLKVTTVRTHVARLFQKTGTSRQATLVRVLAQVLDRPAP